MTTFEPRVGVSLPVAQTAAGIGPASAVVLVIAALLAILSWVEPNHYDPWTSFQGQLAMAVGGLLFASWQVLRALRVPFAIPALAVVFLLAAAVPWIQWRVGLIYFMGDAWVASLYLLGFALTLTIGLRVANVFGLERLLDVVAGITLAAGLLSTWLGLCQWLQLDYLGDFAIGTQPGSRIVANLAQPNQLAMLLVVTAVAVGWLYASARVGGWCAFVTIGLLFIPVPATGSRAGALASIVVVIWLLSARVSAGRRLGPSAVLLGAAAAVVGALIYFAANGILGDDATSVRTVESAASAGTRPIHWASMLDAISRRPWQGYGWNQVVVAQYEVAIDHPASHEVIGASHNLILDLLVANGIPLGFLLVAALVISLFAAMRGARSGAATLAVAVILAIGVYAMVEFPHEYTQFLVLVGLLLGGLSDQPSSRARIVLHRSVPVTLVALLWGLLAITVHDYLNTEANYRAFRFEQARIGLDQPREPLRPVLALTQLHEFLRFARTDAKEQMSADQMLWFEHIAKRYPNWTVLVRWASVLAQNGQQNQAGVVLSRICKTHSKERCISAQRSWEYLGRNRPTIAAVPWPAQQ
jgi:O-antigen ligase